jgi:hypothetical protein
MSANSFWIACIDFSHKGKNVVVRDPCVRS